MKCQFVFTIFEAKHPSWFGSDIEMLECQMHVTLWIGDCKEVTAQVVNSWMVSIVEIRHCSSFWMVSSGTSQWTDSSPSRNYEIQNPNIIPISFHNKIVISHERIVLGAAWYSPKAK